MRRRSLRPSRLPPLACGSPTLWRFSGNAQRPYYALLTQNFPQLISVPRDGLLADASEETLPQTVHMRVLLGEQSALLPNLDALEAALDSLAA